jgi:hypothetical protein
MSMCSIYRAKQEKENKENEKDSEEKSRQRIATYKIFVYYRRASN